MVCKTNIDNFKIYRDIQEDNLFQIFYNIRLITQMVMRQHNSSESKLMLNLSPDNIAICDDRAFVIDDAYSISYSSINEAISKRYPIDIKYSEGYMAPEIKRYVDVLKDYYIMKDIGKVSERTCNRLFTNLRAISEASDMFSIGTILFERIMGRKPIIGVTSIDGDCSIISKYVFPNNGLLEGIDKKVLDTLTRVFHNCLNMNEDSRYRYVEDLMLDIEELCDGMHIENAYRNASFEISEHYSKNNDAVDEIYNAFKEKSYIILTGKDDDISSNIAKQYATGFYTEYNILFFRYSGSIKYMIADDSMMGCRIAGETWKKNDDRYESFTDYCKTKLEKIRRLSDKDTLIIIDGYDDTLDNEELQVLMNYRFKLLIVMDNNDLDIQMRKEGREDSNIAIVEVDNDKVSENRLLTQDEINEMNLGIEEKSVLTMLSLLPKKGIDRKSIMEWCDLEDNSVIELLNKKRLIEKDGCYYSLSSKTRRNINNIVNSVDKDYDLIRDKMNNILYSLKKDILRKNSISAERKLELAMIAYRMQRDSNSMLDAELINCLRGSLESYFRINSEYAEASKMIACYTSKDNTTQVDSHKKNIINRSI